jgi:proteasome accessory factor B
MSDSAAKHVRPPLERMLRIHQALQAAELPTARSLAWEFELSEKSIRRDIEFMRDRLNLPIEFDPRKGGFVYTQSVDAFPSVQISEGELFALLVAERALQQYRGTSFERPLISAIRKLQQSLPDTISLDFAQVEQAISFRTRAEPIVNLGIFDKLAKATSAQNQIEITYKKPGQDKPEARVVDPYHLANINGEWFLFAYDHLRNDLRTFVPARVKSVRPTGQKFSRDRKFSLDKRLRDSFGVRSGEGQHEVVIRFDSRSADFIREKKWHPSQELRDLRGGGVELRMTLSSLDEVQRWILTWGGGAKVVRPPDLVRSVLTAARKVIEEHGVAS